MMIVVSMRGRMSGGSLSELFRSSFPCSWCKVREFQWVQQKKWHSKAMICAMLCYFVCSGWHFRVKFTSLQNTILLFSAFEVWCWL